MNGVSKKAIIILSKYVPKIYIIITLYTLTDSGFNNIQANMLKTVLSTKDDAIVDKLFLSHRYFLEVIFFR